MEGPTTCDAGELYTLDYFETFNPCRLCWRKNAEFNIKEKVPSIYNLKITFTKLVFFCVGISLKCNPSNYPKKLCETCLDTLVKIHRYKTLCSSLNSKLKSIYEETGVQKIPDGIEAVVKEEVADKSDSSPEQDYFAEIEVKFEEPLAANEVEPDLKKKKPPRRCKKDSETKVREKKKKLFTFKNDFFCFICYENLETEERYWQHNSEMHGQESVNSFRCYGCEKTFGNRSGRLCHEKHFCKNLKLGYKCLKCTNTFPCRRLLHKHLKNHMTNTADEFNIKSFDCQHCTLKFAFQSQLSRHLKFDHDERKRSHVCEMCGRGFTKRVYLDEHRKTHTGERGHACTLCDFRAAQKGTLNIHMRKHTGEKPYACEQCDYRSTTSANIVKHKRLIHEGVKKYQCHICGKRYGHRLSLKEHFTAVHGSGTLTPCPECGITFLQMRNLKRHAKTAHGINIKASVKDNG